MAAGIDLRPTFGAAQDIGAVEIYAVTMPDELDRFIGVPYRVHASDPAWVAPLLVDRRAALDRERNPFFRHAEVALWIARRGGRDIGRISAQIDRRAPAGTGWFGMLSAVDDRQVFAALLSTAERWLASRRVRRIVGPFNLSINQEAGLLVDGFDTPPMLLMGHDPPWAGRYVEDNGYAKARDLYAYMVPVDTGHPQPLPRLPEDGAPRISLRTLRLRDYAQEIRTLADIFNDAWRDNWGFVPFAADEVEAMAQRLRPLVLENLVWFAEIDGSPAGFIACLPNVNEATADLGGRLAPFGWLSLLWRLKVRGVRTARIPLMGIRRAHARSVLGSRLAFMLIDIGRRECAALGIRAVEASWILEDNRRIIRIIEAFGGRRYKTYRVYEKLL